MREPGYVSAYTRQLSFAKPFGSSKIVFVLSEAALAASPERATQDLSDARRALSSTAGRNAVVSGIAKSAGNGVTSKDVGLGRLRTLQVGDGAVELPVSIRFKGRRVSESILFLRVDRVLHSSGRCRATRSRLRTPPASLRFSPRTRPRDSYRSRSPRPQ